MDEKDEKTPGTPEIEIGVLERDGEKMMQALTNGSMLALLVGGDVMYVFASGVMFQCFIHALGGGNGRRKAFPIDEYNRNMIRSFAETVDHVFETRFDPALDIMAVMHSSETAILGYLQEHGQLPESARLDFGQGLTPEG